MRARYLAAIAAATVCWLASCQPAMSQPRPVAFQRGITVGEWGPEAYKPAAVRRTVARLHSLHFNTVTLFATWNQGTLRSNDIFSGKEAQPKRNLVAAIRSAKEAGLRVILRPYIDLDNGYWRGDVEPSDTDRWWSSYGQFVMRYARIAARERVNGFVVGTEMVSMSGQAARWRALVARVRGVFGGFVSYQANWSEVGSVSWWDALDAISVSAYYPLSASFDPAVRDLVSGWSNWRASLERLQSKFRRPVYFGEIGYRPVSGTATQPWSVEGGLGRRSRAAQRNAYEAALQVWSNVPWFRGFEWWYLAPQPALVRGTDGADHQPREATLRLLGKRYAQLHR